MARKLHKRAKQLLDSEKKLPVKRTKVLTKETPYNDYKDNGVKEFVENNPNGKEDFEALLEEMIKPRK